MIEQLAPLLTDPLLLACLLGGMFIGVLGGALPGMSALTPVIVFLPITYGLEPIPAMVFLLSIYVGGIYGGSSIAILLNIPGGPENACSAIDGFPLTQKGLAHTAIGTAILSSAIGGIVGSVALLTLAPFLARVALSIGPAEIFGVVFFALCAAGALDHESPAKTYLAALMGVGLATVGLSPLHGEPRFTFGIGVINPGIGFIPVVIGALALSEVFVRLYEGIGKTPVPQIGGAAGDRKGDGGLRASSSRVRLPERSVLKSLVPVWCRNSVIGTVVGVLPGAGATVSSFLAYAAERRINKRGDKFGTGEYAGVAAPESANNAAAMATLVPLLALGIPGGAVAAVMYGVLTLHGLQPGPLLARNNPEVLVVIYGAAFLANVAILVFGLLEARHTAKLLRVPEAFLLPAVVVFAVIGAFSLNNNIFDVWVAVAFGLVGAWMRVYGYSVVALVLGVILGPIMENAFGVAALTSGTRWFVFDSPWALGFIALGILAVLLSVFGHRLRRRRAEVEPPVGGADTQSNALGTGAARDG